MKNNRDNYTLLFLGLLLGIAVSALSVMMKDAIVFRINCDGVTVSDWSGDRYCINPTASK